MSETDNLDIWNKLGKTDPSQTKKFKRAGGFTGTAIKPIYQLQKMTETFGVAGEGWGTGEPVFQVVPGVNQEIMVYCTVGLWIKKDANPDHWVWGVGGDKVVSYVKANDQYNRPERWENDDEAFKKAFTDAVGNAMKHLGMSADVHMGLFDDSKHVREREAEESGADRQTGEIHTKPSSEPVERQEEALPAQTARAHFAVIRDALFACTTLQQLKGEFSRSQPVVGLMEESYQTDMSEFYQQIRNKIVEVANAELEAAKTMAELQDVFKRVYKDARDDPRVAQELTAVKDKRKSQLDTPPPQAADPKFAVSAEALALAGLKPTVGEQLDRLQADPGYGKP